MRKFIHAKNAGGMVLVFALHKYRVTIYDLFYSQYAFLTRCITYEDVPSPAK